MLCYNNSQLYIMKIIALIVGAYLLGYIFPDLVSGHFSIFSLNDNQANTFIAYGTWAAVVAALTIAVWGKTLKTFFYKPKITMLDITRFNHNHTLDVWRLPFTNTGNDTAKDVQVEIVEVIDDRNKKRNNFLPIPLLWTHLDKETRDILPRQTAYLDVFEHINQEKLSNITHYLRFGSRFAQEIKDFCFLEPGTSQIKLKLFQKEGKSYAIVVNAEWDGEFLFDAGLKGKQMYWKKRNKKHE
jgi:hypothetical protein